MHGWVKITVAVAGLFCGRYFASSQTDSYVFATNQNELTNGIAMRCNCTNVGLPTGSPKVWKGETNNPSCPTSVGNSYPFKTYNDPTKPNHPLVTIKTIPANSCCSISTSNGIRPKYNGTILTDRSCP